MPTIDVVGAEGKPVGTLNLEERLWRGGGAGHEIYEAVRNLLANRRAGTHATKTRTEVSGGGKKPWRQKGTGRARAGSTRSPLWRGGATTHGPQPRDYAYELPRQVRREAFRQVLAQKLREGQLTVLDGLALPEAKTRQAAALLRRLGVEGRTVVLSLKPEPRFERAARNLPLVDVRQVADVNTYEILRARRVLVTREAVGPLEARMAGAPTGGTKPA